MKSYKTKHLTTAVILLLVFFSACRNTAPAENRKPADNGQQTVVKMADDSFFEAALNGDLEMVNAALTAGVSANQKDAEGRTALMYASYNGHIKLVDHLITKGADVNIRDKYGRTALMMAASGPFSETVKILLENNAWPDLVDNEERFTALMYAAAEGQMENVKLLLSFKADPTLKDIDGDDALTFALNNKHTGVADLIRTYTGK
jgi:ankyrin repeat protein